MAYLSDNVHDFGLDYIYDYADRVDICSQEPATYTEATSTYSLGNKTSVVVSAPQAGDVSGRKVTIQQIPDGSTTDTGTATHWALTYVSGTELIASAALAASGDVSSGGVWTLPNFDIEKLDP